MKVFVTGATGYVGSAVAQAFRRAGHEVYGLVRSSEKAKTLEWAEIAPVLGDLADPSSYIGAAERCSLLVHVAVDYAGDTFALDRKTVEALIALGEKGARPKTFIYTSGTWVYGNTGDAIVDETSPLKPAHRVAWRPATERLVLESKQVRGLVIRPGCIYGRQGSMTGEWFEGGRKKALSVVGNGRNRWAMVHIDDVADGYVRAGESGLAGEVFNFADGSRSSVAEMAGAAARAAGFAGEIHWISEAEASKEMGDFAECLALDQNLDASKAARLLGWRPRHRGFVEEVETYYRAWSVTQ